MTFPLPYIYSVTIQRKPSFYGETTPKEENVCRERSNSSSTPIASVAQTGGQFAALQGWYDISLPFDWLFVVKQIAQLAVCWDENKRKLMANVSNAWKWTACNFAVSRRRMASGAALKADFLFYLWICIYMSCYSVQYKQTADSNSSELSRKNRYAKKVVVRGFCLIRMLYTFSFTRNMLKTV